MLMRCQLIDNQIYKYDNKYYLSIVNNL